MRKASLAVLAVLAASLFAGCGDDNPNDPSDKGKGVAKEGRNIKFAASPGGPGGSGGDAGGPGAAKPTAK